MSSDWVRTQGLVSYLTYGGAMMASEALTILSSRRAPPPCQKYMVQKIVFLEGGSGCECSGGISVMNT